MNNNMAQGSENNNKEEIEITQDVWDFIKKFVGDLPSDSVIHFSDNMRARENVLVQEVLESDMYPLPLFFAALDVASIKKFDEKFKTVKTAILRIFGSDIGFALMSSDAVQYYLENGLKHANVEVRKMTIKIVNNFFTSKRVVPETGGLSILQRKSLCLLMIACVTDENISVGQYSADVVVEILKTDSEIASEVFSKIIEHVDILNQTKSQQNSTFSLRYADLVAQLSCISAEILEIAKQTEAVNVIFSLMEGDDILLQLSIIESLENLAKTIPGASYLFKNGIAKKLLFFSTGIADLSSHTEEVTTLEGDPILGGTAIRILSCIYNTVLAAHNDTAMDANTRQMITDDLQLTKSILFVVVSYMDSTSESSKLAAMHAICNLATASPLGLNTVLNEEKLRETWLPLKAHKPELKAAILHSFSKVLAQTNILDTNNSVNESENNPVADEEHEQFLELRKAFFDLIAVYNNQRSTMEMFVTILKSPIPETRIAIYNILISIAKQNSGWGLEKMITHAGFPELLLNRRTEPNKACLEWKFSVIEAIMNNEAKSHIDQELLNAFTNYLKEGPFYTRPEATEITAQV